MHPHNPDELLAFYEERILPALYRQLDRAFPELEWTWTGEGWKGVKKTEQGVWNRFDQTAIVCNHPWGFVTRAGTATSWLAYINGGLTPTGARLAACIRKLADLAGIECSWQPTLGSYRSLASNDGISSAANAHPTPHAAHLEPGPPAGLSHFTETPKRSHSHQRQLALWEAFVAFCHECLCSGDEAHDAHLDDQTAPSHVSSCAAVREKLQQDCGIDPLRADNLPLGVFPDPTAVHEHLLSSGFTEEEIVAAAVVSDNRLAGRVIVPWRDSLGRIATIIAEDITAGDRHTARRLYIKGGARPAVFGLDVALRPASGGADELILVDSPLDVVFFQQHGLPNTVMMAAGSHTPTKQDWEILGDLGVSNVTLALADDSSGSTRTCKSLLDACTCTKVPHVFALPFGSLQTSQAAGDFARTHGMGRLLKLLSRRQHAYRYLGAALVRRHRPGQRAGQKAIGQILREAIAFDAAVYTPARETALDEHFWQEVLTATRVHWRAIRPRLAHRPAEHPAPENGTWQPEEASRSRQPSLDWVNGLLHALADEQAEKWQTVWTNDPPPRPRNWQLHRPDVTLDDIRARAYQLWEQKGRPAGADQQCWLEAEQSLRHSGRKNGYHAA